MKLKRKRANGASPKILQARSKKVSFAEKKHRHTQARQRGPSSEHVTRVSKVSTTPYEGDGVTTTNQTHGPGGNHG